MAARAVLYKEQVPQISKVIPYLLLLDPEVGDRLIGPHGQS